MWKPFRHSTTKYSYTSQGNSVEMYQYVYSRYTYHILPIWGKHTQLIRLFENL